MAALLAALSAVAFGAADFLGGFATQRVRVLVVVGLSHIAGLGLLLLAMLALPAASFAMADVWWGAAAGLAGLVGLAALYLGLARGRIGVVSPIAAVVSPVLPIAVGLTLGERPSTLALVGAAIALPAVLMVSVVPGQSGTAWSLKDALAAKAHLGLAAGVAFGAFFVLLDRSGPDSGLWPLVGARAASILAVGVGLALINAPLRPDPGSLRLIVGAGILDMAANILFLLATREGLLTLVALLASLYPAVTVLLARVVLSERLAGIQVAGLGLAVLAVAAIGAGG